MKITDYSFGNITIDGNRYSKDVIIYPDHVFSPWWRKEGHLLHLEDLEDVINAKPSLLIIGTGYYSTMKVPDKVLKALESKGIRTCIESTPKAVDLYNGITEEREAIAALHLTC